MIRRPNAQTSPHAERLRGRTIVIVGASSGIGRGVALRAAAGGAHVVVFARRGDALTELASTIEASGGSALAVAGDASSVDDIARLADAAVERFGRIDVWINNVGIGSIGRFWDVPVDEHLRIVEANVGGAVVGMHEALGRFVAQRSGVLLNTASVESEVPLAYQASYAATKAAMLSLIRSVRQELRLAKLPDVRVGSIMPWAVNTPWWRHAGNHTGRVLKMPLMDEPAKVVDAVIRACSSPRERQPVGWKARAAVVSNRLSHSVTTRLSADVVHLRLLRGARIARTSGAVLEPTDDPATVAGDGAGH